MTEHTQSTHPSLRQTMARRPGRLRVRIGDGPTLDVTINSSRGVWFGRSRRIVDVVIADQSVSKSHFSLRAVDDGVELEDLGSKNGTWFERRRIRRMTLLPGDRFWAGEIPLQLVDIDHVDVEVTEAAAWGLLHGKSVAMRELFSTLTRVAFTDVDLVIHGEPGTGKRLAAQSIHQHSSRSTGPLVFIDCAALPSEVAHTSLPGLLEQTDGGVLVLDDIEHLPPESQAMLLCLLDARTFNVRVIAISRRDLTLEVEAGRLSKELHQRLATATVRMPALRERGQDICMLAEQLLVELCQPDESPKTLAEDAKLAMGAYDWPGNVRELERTIRRAARSCDGGLIRAEVLDFGGMWEDRLAAELDMIPDYDTAHEALDRLFLPRVLAECGTVSATARRLKITRDRLRSKLRAMGLWDQPSTGASGPTSPGEES